MLVKVPFLLSLLVIQFKHLFWFTLLKYIFTPEFLRKADAFFAKSDELVPEFTAEVIFPYAVLGSEEQISNPITEVAGEYLKS